uniref:Mucin-5AC isoform X2 n=1 Tax=Geotrypetes seraphini TaxID=260995 RepID=A0A6P8QBC9_GEOSA|nr:mucin-5AC isoform X2 [Geotrypetes seraphini]
MGIGGRAWIHICILVIASTFVQQEVQAQYDYNVDQTDQQQQVQAQYDYNVDQTDQQQQVFVTVEPSQKVTIIPGLQTMPVIKSITAAHNGKVCSTWGNFYFKTFDGDVYHFPGTCNYIFSSHCKSNYEDFNIQIRRSVVNNVVTIGYITMKIEGIPLEIKNNSVVVNGAPVQLPYSKSGIQIKRSGVNLKMTAKLGLSFMWNGEDNILLELDDKYANQTCGLCGDYNHISIQNEFISNNVKLTALQFGSLQKLDGPTEECEDPVPTTQENCMDYENLCHRVLTSTAFLSCNALVGIGPYMEACVQDLCHCNTTTNTFCMCNTFAEYSRQCAHAGGSPQSWRAADFCPKQCPFNMQYQECGSPCADTCSNSEQVQVCEEHCMDGCFCPPGTVLDDINNAGCIPLKQCSCTYQGNTYAPGAGYSTSFQSCSCAGGQWQCEDLPHSGTCSVEGGSHITTYDENRYTVHGDCSYVLSKLCDSNTFTILGELRKCGLSDSETCLKSVALTLGGGDTIIVFKPGGSVFVNWIYTQLPFSAANVTVLMPTSFFLIVHTNLGLQIMIQLVPIMQIYVNLDPSYKEQTCGLCGNFNNVQADDFKTISGIVEGTAASFANTWKTQANCPNVKNIFENPCTLSIENEKYAEHWCSLLTDSSGPFAPCHGVVTPDTYLKNCMFDTCNCEKSENCMCAALSSYVRACTAKGVTLSGWRENVCTKYTTTCPKSLTYSYSVTSCQPTCRSLSEPDVTCSIKFAPVDGCTCKEGLYLNDDGKCVPSNACPCYHKGSLLPSGEVVYENAVMCTCTQGKLSCIGGQTLQPVCTSPMVYFDCTNTTAGTTGSECQKSCHTLDMECYSTQCISGCLCPEGLVSDGSGSCITEDKCPCIHNEATYQPGAEIKVRCNTCSCKNRIWQCSNKPCLATCSVYGDGHYITFDEKRYSFSGDCEYTLAQDHCGKNSGNSTFRVITENIPCGTTGTTCSKAIKIFLETYELILTEEHFEVLERGAGKEVPYKIRTMGIYLVIEAKNGLILMWDRKTSIFIKLSSEFQGKVCGLCGNYDGNAINDFTTRSQSVVSDVIEFGNSWKFSPTCPDASETKDPCTANPYRKSWAQKQCSIINSEVFAACHPQVDPEKYYESCVTDACACDTGGDCECFCTAVAAYAQACGEANICVSWRTPTICPLFCDYYNPDGECEWHYKPCGAPCLKTCRNPSGKCANELLGLEGCYPSCPSNMPLFDEDEMKCVDRCGCYDDEGNHYKQGAEVPTTENCQSCLCTMEGIKCNDDVKACQCEYEGKMYKYHDVIYNTTDGIGGCISAICGADGKIERSVSPCTTTSTPTTTFHFSTSLPSPSVTTTTTTSPVCVIEQCEWSEWFDVSYPAPGPENGDFDTFENIKAKGYKVCSLPKEVKCRAERFPDTLLEELDQNVQCDKTLGLICYNKDQLPPICYNYEIQMLCCSYVTCNSTTTPTSTTATEETASTTTEVPTTTSTLSETASTLTSTPTTVVTTSSISTSPTPETTTSQTTTAPSTTFRETSTSVCQPKCKWTAWFDVDLPNLGSTEGDFETYENIRAAGENICKKPEDIHCRAEKFPTKTTDQIGQIVQCNVSFGLVCRNQEQTGEFQMCYNYQIQVLCCDDYSHCSTTTFSTTLPPSITTTLPIPSSVETTTQPETSTTKVITTPVSTTTTTETTSSVIIITPKSTVPPATPHEIETTVSKTTIPPMTTTTVKTTTETTTTEKSPTQTIVITTPSTSTPTTTTESTPVITTETRVTTIPSTTTITETVPSSTTTKIATTTITTETTPIPVTSTSTKETTFVPIPTTTPKTTSTITEIPPTSTVPITTTISTITETTVTPVAITTTAQTTEKIQISTVPIPPTTSTIIQTTTPTTTHSITTIETSTPSAGCKPKCKWSTWFDVDYPTSGPNGGDIETYENIIGAGKSICKKPQNIQCRAENFRDISIDEIGQIVTCDVSTGLVCRNRDQMGKSKLCYNYEMRVLCCDDYSDCETTTPTISVTTTPTTTSTTETSSIITTTETTVTTIPSTTSTTENVPITTTTPTSTVPIPPTTPPTTNPTTTIETSTPIKGCKPKCKWSTWFDVDYPTSGPNGGDIETYENIIGAGKSICKKPQNIQCRAENFRDISIDEIGQIVTCDVSTGLVCRNRDQMGKSKLCYNYEMRVLCCDDYSDCETTTPTISVTTTPTTTSTTETSSIITTTETIVTTIPSTTENVPITTTTPTSTVPIPPTTPPTTNPTTTIETSTPSTGCKPKCKWSTWFDVDYPTSGPNGGDIETYENIIGAGKSICKKPQNIQCRAENFRDISIDEIGQIVTCDVSTGLVCRNQDQMGKSKLCYNYEMRVLCCDDYSDCETTTPTISVTTTPTTTSTTETSSIITTTETTVTTIPSTTENVPITTTTPTSTVPIPPTTPPTTNPTTTIETRTPSTGCKPKCKWSTWFDVDYPTSGPDGGDIETYENIIGAGKSICKKPQNIQCRAENFRDISIDEIGQIVTCDVSTGLVCRNQDQMGKSKLCYNYEMRVLCCDDYSDCETTTPTISVTTTPTTTSTTETSSIITTTETTVTTIPSTTENVPITTTTPTSTVPIPPTTPPTTNPTTTIETSTPIKGCKPKCKWSTWFDVDYPTSGPNGGDIETYENIIGAGKSICKKPQNIQCRAENFRDISIDEIGQIVTCDVSTGLVCRNRDQMGKSKLCYNYEMRVLCCDDYSDCETTTPTISVTTTPTTASTTETSSIITTTETTVTTIPSTTENVPITTTTPTSTVPIPPTTPPTTNPTTTIETRTPSTGCKPKCKWSTWFDVDYPTSGPDGGDIETYENIIGAGKSICKKPQNIQCRAENFRYISIDEIGQIVTCDVSTGLVCRNRDQMGKSKLCYNYEMRVLCCDDYSDCETTTPTISVTTTPTTASTTETSSIITTTETTVTTIPSTTENVPITTTTPTSTVPIPPTTPPTTNPTTTIETSTPSTGCKPKCKWSTWFDVDYPTSGPNGGDIETYENIIGAGKSICKKPQNIQCRAENFRDISIDEIGQIVTCDVSTGLVCRNRDQMGKSKLCYNYEMRVLCCDDYSDCETTTPTISVTTTPTTASTTETSSIITTTETTVTTIPSTTENVPITTTTPTSTVPIPPTTPPTTNPTTTIETSTPSTGCKPNCKWSTWFDVDYPTSGPNGGDIETYENIIGAGKSICKKPQHIQCRAENFRDISIDDIGQIVTCDVSTGLVCRNRDQMGKSKLCYNYEMRVLCCDDYSHCTTTSPVSSEIVVTTSMPTSTMTETTPVITTPCFCYVHDHYYSPGETIYNTTDASGCIFYAKCSKACDIERFPGPCVSTTHPTAPTTSETTQPTTPKTTSSTSLEPGCPPKQVNESWDIGNCTVATCKGNNVVTIEPVKCPPATLITCESEFPPIKVYREDGCCFHYECECVCSGWGDPHYITFDGTYYTFLDNCTYILVQQITARYGNFRVYIDNYYCDAKDGLSCPQSLIINYKSTEIILTRVMYQGRMTNRIKFNKLWVIPGFTKNGITVSTTGIRMIVEIPEIQAFISFTGMIFVVKLPFSKFGYNTEGQCGTCTNNRKDDCRLPDGTIVANCSDMAPKWMINVREKPYCSVQPPVKPTSPPTPCLTPPVCEIIMSDIFADCHKLVPPEHYFEGCVFDSCHMRNESIPCSSIELYASHCITHGVCINWRNKTNGKCPYNCPVGKVYEACGPRHPETCDARAVQSINEPLAEGCFCAPGTTLFNSVTDICVKKCSCVGPDGMPKLPGETWTSNCQQCACDENTVTVQCQLMQCPEPEPVTCTKEGFVSVPVPTPENPCCLKTECQCNISHCSPDEKTCELGFEKTSIISEEACCPTFYCKPMDVCVYQNTVYQPGTPIPVTKGSCEECDCSDEIDSNTKLHRVQCQPISCEQECQPGFEYTKKAEQCCGECVQVACIVKTENENVKVLRPGEIWYLPGNKCTYYTCEHINGQFITNTVTSKCLVSSQQDCETGFEYKKVAGECCGKCVQVACIMQMDNTTQVLQPGEVWNPPADNCVSYECEEIEDQFVLSTLKRVCPDDDEKTCKPGYVLKQKPGECCSHCVQVACPLQMKDNTTHVIQPGQIWSPPGDKCVYYECEEFKDQFVIVTWKKTCPAFNLEDCIPGSVQKTEDGCCQICVQKESACKLRKKSTVIKSGLCQSSEPVELAYCEGSCGTSSVYSAEANLMEHTCSCCQEVQTSKKKVTLTCLDGTNKSYSYIYVDKCGCAGTECDQDSQSQQQQQQ